jgi:hypothetical protein
VKEYGVVDVWLNSLSESDSLEGGPGPTYVTIYNRSAFAGGTEKIVSPAPVPAFGGPDYDAPLAFRL